MFTHPKTRRLLKREEFKRLFRSKLRFSGKFFSIEYNLRKELLFPRLGITITRQYGKANLRNLFKRRIKEIFRKKSQTLAYGIDLNVRATPKTLGSYEDLLIEFERFLQTLK